MEAHDDGAAILGRTAAPSWWNTGAERVPDRIGGSDAIRDRDVGGGPRDVLGLEALLGLGLGLFHRALTRHEDGYERTEQGHGTEDVERGGTSQVGGQAPPADEWAEDPAQAAGAPGHAGGTCLVV